VPSEASASDDLYVLRCWLPPSAGDPTGERYVGSYGLYNSFGLSEPVGLHLTGGVDAALRVPAREAQTLSREIRELYGLDVEPHAVGASGGNPPPNNKPV
jgi:hypothetical protein